MQTLTGDHWKIHVADVMEGLAKIPAGSVHCVVTSPPYWQLRDYGFDGQIGLEKTPEEFIESMVRVFREVRRTLRDDGVCFVNFGDTYCKDSKSGGTSGSKNEYQMAAGVVPRGYRSKSGLQYGDMVGIPARVVLDLQADGWVWRSEIIWYKSNPMTETLMGTHWDEKTGRLRRGAWRPSRTHEVVYMLTKGRHYFCDGDSSKEPTSGTAHHRGKGINQKAASFELPKSRDLQPRQNASHSLAISGLVGTRNVRTVWKLSNEQFKGKHFAAFPTELVRRCLTIGISKSGCCSACGSQHAPIVRRSRVATRPGKNTKIQKADTAAGCQPGREDANVVGNRDPERHETIVTVTGYKPICDCNAETSRPTVLDPFGGSMTTGQVAINMGCEFIGIEGKPEYADLGVERLETPWIPVAERKKPRGKRRRRVASQKELF